MDTLYFFADFNNYIATISNKKPKHFIFTQFPIKWKNNGTIILASNINFNFLKSKKSNKQITSLLKSSLQKQIRRRLNSSFNTCKELLYTDSFELFRRLIVISFEDVIPNVHTSLLCWLMAASSKNLVINSLIETFIYNYIKILLETKDYLIFKDNTNTNINIMTLGCINKFNHDQKNIIKSIYFRTAYGGLKGDLIMINNVLYHYLNDNIQLKEYNPNIFKNKIHISGPLKIHICAIDHHIYPAIIDFLYSKFNYKYKYSKELLQTIIWECNSKKNTRKDQYVNSEYIDIFKNIKSELRILQYKYLNNIITLFNK